MCKGCGQQKSVIGYEESEYLDVEPAQYFVVGKREKRACRKCEEHGVITAPLPPRIIEKRLVSNRIVIEHDCEQVQPASASLSAELDAGAGPGSEPERATLDGWVRRWG